MNARHEQQARLRTIKECTSLGFKFTFHPNKMTTIYHSRHAINRGAFITSNVNPNMFGNLYSVYFQTSVNVTSLGNERHIYRVVLDDIGDYSVYKEMLDFDNDFFKEKDFKIR